MHRAAKRVQYDAPPSTAEDGYQQKLPHRETQPKPFYVTKFAVKRGEINLANCEIEASYCYRYLCEDPSASFWVDLIHFLTACVLAEL